MRERVIRDIIRAEGGGGYGVSLQGGSTPVDTSGNVSIAQPERALDMARQAVPAANDPLAGILSNQDQYARPPADSIFDVRRGLTTAYGALKDVFSNAPATAAIRPMTTPGSLGAMAEPPRGPGSINNLPSDIRAEESLVGGGGAKSATTPEAPPGASRGDVLGGLTLASAGLQAFGQGVDAPAMAEPLGAIGMTVAGIAKMLGAGGAWATPVAIGATLLNMAGMMKSGVMRQSYQKRILGAYSKALATAGNFYRGR